MPNLRPHSRANASREVGETKNQMVSRRQSLRAINGSLAQAKNKASGRKPAAAVADSREFSHSHTYKNSLRSIERGIGDRSHLAQVSAFAAPGRAHAQCGAKSVCARAPGAKRTAL